MFELFVSFFSFPYLWKKKFVSMYFPSKLHVQTYKKQTIPFYTAFLSNEKADMVQKCANTCLNSIFVTSTIFRVFEQNPEYWTVAPKTESIKEPKNPQSMQYIMIKNWYCIKHHVIPMKIPPTKDPMVEKTVKKAITMKNLGVDIAPKFRVPPSIPPTNMQVLFLTFHRLF